MISGKEHKIYKTNDVQLDTKMIYYMDLHDLIYTELWSILRVPGGWIYYKSGYRSSYHVFVPYSKEFKPMSEAEEKIDELKKEIFDDLNEL